MTRGESGAVFVMPRRSTEWAGAGALWITAAGWAAAARARYGAAWIVTPDGVATPEDAIGFVRAPAAGTSKRWTTRIPTPVRTAVLDVQRLRASRQYRDVGEREAWNGTKLAFVWQHHDLFHDAGTPLARRHRCPLVSYVHAPQVWEARKWGVRRPGWGGLLESTGEARQLRASHVVACVSDEVAQEVVRLGVEPNRVLVSPMAVDATAFTPERSGAEVRRRLDLDGHFVVGWTGSFRRFHGLELAIEAFATLHRDDPQARLLLVGEGAERATIEQVASQFGVREAVAFAGAAPFTEVPDYVGAMDVTVVTARSGEEFHYSPLKMREYLAAGRPVVAPLVGDIRRTLEHGVNALLYEPGDAPGLAEHLLTLRADDGLRDRLGVRGRELMLATGTWEVQLARLVESAPFCAAVASIAAT